MRGDGPLQALLSRYGADPGGDRERATLLIEFGARRSRLGKERRVALDELLASPSRAFQSLHGGRCRASGT